MELRQLHVCLLIAARHLTQQQQPPGWRRKCRMCLISPQGLPGSVETLCPLLTPLPLPPLGVTHSSHPHCLQSSQLPLLPPQTPPTPPPHTAPALLALGATPLPPLPPLPCGQLQPPLPPPPIMGPRSNSYRKPSLNLSAGGAAAAAAGEQASGARCVWVGVCGLVCVIK